MDNKLDPIFGNGGRFAGYILILVSILPLMSDFSVSNTGMSLTIFMVAAFMSFSYSGAEIDLSNRLFRHYQKFFGLFKKGNWYELDSYDGLMTGRNLSKFVLYSRSNQAFSEGDIDIRIMLCDRDQKVTHHLKKCENLEVANKEIKELGDLLQLKVLN